MLLTKLTYIIDFLLNDFQIFEYSRLFMEFSEAVEFSEFNDVGLSCK